MVLFGGSNHRSKSAARVVVWALAACASIGSPSFAGESPTLPARVAEKVKVRRQLRAAERLTMAPRAKRTFAVAPGTNRPVAPVTVASAAAPAVASAAPAGSGRLFDVPDASKSDGAAGSRANASGCVITGRALLGEPQLARFAQRIGEVDVERCFDAIPAMKTIKQEELRPTRARYHFLMRQANVDLQRAIAAAASRRGVTLVVERGGVQNGGDKSIDLTQSVLDALQSAP
ncbi:MAG: hypothetical protein IT459_22030 [Planctomycetes bacterium]|nr:hypothetical protein [Planctomycetota bacterium]